MKESESWAKIQFDVKMKEMFASYKRDDWRMKGYYKARIDIEGN